jgi:hypothetical protein
MLEVITDDQKLRSKHLEAATERTAAIRQIADSTQVLAYAQLFVQFGNNTPQMLQMINQLRSASAQPLAPAPPALGSLVASAAPPPNQSQSQN